MTTYFVSSVIGSNTNAGTSTTSPLATLQAAQTLVKPGDTVEVMNGTYTGSPGGNLLQVTTSGTSGAPITFEAMPGQTPVLNTSGMWNGILVQASYINIEGFTVVGGAASYTLAQALAQYGISNPNVDGNGIEINASGTVAVPNHITIQNNTVYNEPGGGIGTVGADYVQILNNTVYNNAHWSAYGNSGISIASSVNSDTKSGIHDTISGNTSYGNTELVPYYWTGTITDGEGIILDTNTGFTGEILVQGNTAYGNSGAGIESFETNNAVINGNTAYANLSNPLAAGDGQIFINQSTNDVVTNNVTIAPGALAGSVALSSATEDVALPAATAIATFTDANTNDTASGFTATINWGDGSAATTGAVVGSAGSFTVEAGHTYPDEGSDPLSVTIKRTSDNATLSLSGTVTVGEDDVLAGTGKPISATVNQAFTGTVATFTDTDLVTPASGLAATINWGDGTPTTAGVISGSSGAFTVSGTHNYATSGSDKVTVTLSDDAPGTATATASSTATVAAGALAGSVALSSATEDVALPAATALATFTDANTSDTASSFTATINWGDGSAATTGTVVGSAGSFTVEAGHTYPDEGSDPLSVTIKRTSDNATLSLSGQVMVGEDDVLAGTGKPISATVNQAFTGTVATFTDTDLVTPASGLAATINWGDGTATTAGVISGSSGAFTVSGTHAYATSGSDKVTVTLSDDAPGTATATATSTATVAGLASPPPPVSAGSGPDTLVLLISEQAYANGDGTSDAAGDSLFTVSVDGQQIGGISTALASHSTGQDQTFNLSGDWTPMQHTVTVNFLNGASNPAAPDANGSIERNLYVDSVTYDGTNTSQSATLIATGSTNFIITDTAPSDAADTITLPNAPTTTTVSQNDVTVLAGGHRVYTLTVNGTHDMINLTSGSSDTISALLGSNAIITSGANDRITFAGSNNVINAGGGINSLTDQGSNNTIIMPGSGQGTDNTYGSVLTNGDTLDFRSALQRTSWDGLTSDIASYMHVNHYNGDAIVSISNSAGGSASIVGYLHGAGTVSLSTLLAHSLV